MDLKFKYKDSVVALIVSSSSDDTDQVQSALSGYWLGKLGVTISPLFDGSLPPHTGRGGKRVGRVGEDTNTRSMGGKESDVLKMTLFIEI